MRQFTEKYIREIEFELRRLEREGRLTPAEVARQMNYIERGMFEEVERFLFTNLYTPQFREPYDEIAKIVLPGFTHYTKSVEDEILFRLREGIKDDKQGTLIKKDIVKAINAKEYLANTWVMTGTGAVDQGTTIRDAIEAGATGFRYAGPPAEREFCKRMLLLDKVWTKEEIEQLDTSTEILGNKVGNGQRLPILYFRGGYNCRHEWEAVFNGIKLTEQEKIVKSAILNANKLGQKEKDEEVPTFYYTPILDVAYQLGKLGIDLKKQPDFEGYRYGDAPDNFISYNYAEQKSEKGLSLAVRPDGSEIGSAMWFTERKKRRYKGLLLPMRGSDGEALILCYNAPIYD